MIIEESVKKEEEFKKDLAEVINKHSREQYSNTPDFILADYLYWCLANYQNTINANFDWHKDK